MKTREELVRTAHSAAAMSMQGIEFEPDEIAVAAQWHGGQTSMLYAMASTGALSCGSERYRPDVDCDCPPDGTLGPCSACRGTKMTDAQWLAQWLAYLAGKLESEASESLDEARLRVKRAKRARRRDEAREMAEHAVALDGIAAKCRAAIVKLGGAS